MVCVEPSDLDCIESIVESFGREEAKGLQHSVTNAVAPRLRDEHRVGCKLAEAVDDVEFVAVRNSARCREVEGG